MLDSSPLARLLPPQSYAAAKAERLRRSVKATRWQAGFEYRNSETKKLYTPHNEAEQQFVTSDIPPYPALLGGEGSGKTTAGVIKDLERVRRGMSGIVVSPNLPHFRRSLWPEFRRWCPWEFVVESQRYRQAADWTPHEQFELVFDLPGNPRLLLGGLVGERGQMGSWEGPNVHFFHIDEARHLPSPSGLKVLVGRARLTGPNGEPPQGWITSTGGSKVITDYYGPMLDNDPHASFKRLTSVTILLTAGNLQNTSADYLTNRSAVFDAQTEVDIYTGVDPWGEIVDNPFLESIALWDRLIEPLPVLTRREPLVLAVDAGISGDSFGLLGVTRHPTDRARHSHIAPRLAIEWKPAGTKLDFEAAGGPLPTIRELCRKLNVVTLVYDPYQLHAPMTTLSQSGITWVQEFSQGAKRAEADSDLLTHIVQGTTAHDGTLTALRAHLSNANRKVDQETRKIRLVKRRPDLKIDLAVCFSMASYAALELNL